MDTIVVETTGNFMLQDITNGAAIEAEGTTEVYRSAFVDQQIELGRLKETGGTADHKIDRYEPKDEEEKKPDPKLPQEAQQARTNDSTPRGAESRNTTKK